MGLLRALCVGISVLLGVGAVGWAQKPAQQIGRAWGYTFENDSLHLYHQQKLVWAMHLPTDLQVGHHGLAIREKMGSYRFKRKAVVKVASAKWELHLPANVDWVWLEGQLPSGHSLVLRLQVEDASRLSITLEANAIGARWVQLTGAAFPGEVFWGGGAQAPHLRLNGHLVPFFTEEQGIGKGDLPISRWMRLVKVAGDDWSSYAPVPFVLSSAGRAFSLDDLAYTRADFRTPGKVQFESWNHQMQFQLYDSPKLATDSAAGLKPLLTAHTAHTGRMPALPDWAWGTWLGLQGGATAVTQRVDSALAAGNPVTAVWIQDWVGRRQTRYGSQLWWWWRPHESYGDFPAFVRELNAKGVQVLGYINSFLAQGTPMAEHALRNGYVVRNRKDEPYTIVTPGFPAWLVDLHNPDAYAWLKEIIKHNLIGNGLAGWMADYAEWLPADAVVYPTTTRGRNALALHNEYAVLWAQLNREAIAEAGKAGEVVFFTRSGNVGSARQSTLFWQGDQMVDWGAHDGLASTIPLMLSSGLSGITLNHSDIGGYTTVHTPIVKYHRTRELLQRWTELNAFSLVFRTHEGLMPKRNAQVYDDPAAVAFFAQFGKTHYALRDYWADLNRQATEAGLPPIRPMWLEFPELVQQTPVAAVGRKRKPSKKFLAKQPEWHELSQFMVGGQLLFAPVTRKGVVSAKAYLPAGQWTHAYTGEVFTGGKVVEVAAPIGQPAVWIRHDATPTSQRLLDNRATIFVPAKP